MGTLCRLWALGFRVHAVACSVISVSRSAAVCHMFVLARWEARHVMPLLGARNHVHGRGCARGSPVLLLGSVVGVVPFVFFFSPSFSLLLWRMRATCLSLTHTFRMFLLPHCSPPFPLTGSVTRRAGVFTMRWTLEQDVSPTSSLAALPLNPRGIHPTLNGLCVRTRISRLTST